MMEDKRENVLTEAAFWVGTPYRHQAAVLGAGCDCVGLIRGVGFATGVLPPLHDEWKRFNAYSRLPSPRKMGEGMRTFLVPIEGDPLPGDIVWLSWRPDLPMHLGILGKGSRGQPLLIHCFSDVGGVVQHGFTELWRERVHSWWRYPGLVK